MADGPAALDIRSLSKSYGRSRGIIDVSLTVRPGEVVGLVGANGAGKTTLMRTVLDFLRPTSGHVTVFGLDSVQDSVAVRQRISYLPGELVLPPRLTGHRVLERYAFTRPAADLARAPGLAERLGLDLSRRVGDLSKGNRQKLGLVLTFAPRVDLFILDEPTSGLDPLMQREFAAVVGSARERGATVLLSSHVMSEVEHVGTKVAVLQAGRLVAFDEMSTIRSRARRRARAVAERPEEARALAAALRVLPDVDEVQLEDRAITFACRGHVDSVIKRLAGVTITALEIGPADLEDTFFHPGGQPSAPADGITHDPGGMQ